MHDAREAREKEKREELFFFSMLARREHSLFFVRSLLASRNSPGSLARSSPYLVRVHVGRERWWVRWEKKKREVFFERKRAEKKARVSKEERVKKEKKTRPEVLDVLPRPTSLSLSRSLSPRAAHDLFLLIRATSLGEKMEERATPSR